jgi:hypothetical protein
VNVSVCVRAHFWVCFCGLQGSWIVQITAPRKGREREEVPDQVGMGRSRALG